MSKVVLWGTGHIAEVVHYYLSNDSEHDVCAFCVDRKYLTDSKFKGKPVVAFEDIEKMYPPLEYSMAIPIGYKNLNKDREVKYLAAKEKGYRFISYVHSSSLCDGSIGENTFILAQNNIQPFSNIGNNVIVWTSSFIGHHSIIEDHCFIASSDVSGAVKVKNNCFLGVGSAIAHSLEIGEYSIIGAGAVVMNSIPAGSVLAVKQTPALPVQSWDMQEFLD